MASGNTGNDSRDSSSYLIVNDENGGIWDLFFFLVFNDGESRQKFVRRKRGFVDAYSVDEEGGIFRRWVIFVSIVAMKVIKFFGKPLEWTGYALEFVLNFLSHNGNFVGLLWRIFRGNVVIPERGSETFISAIGHLDGRIDLLKNARLSEEISDPDFEKKTWENQAVMDLCMIASKLAYENAKVVRNVVELHWKMHFVDFYNCWNDYQKERSTQVFMMCDKPKDADLILIGFRGTEPFDADDWVTDFDYSWYQIPELGKVHVGFIEALGLGNRTRTSTIRERLQPMRNGYEDEVPSDKEAVPVMNEMSAYYVVRSKLKELLDEHRNAKFLVTGHSLGGALAILFPTVLVLHEEEEVMQRLLGVYTYGQPRVGNSQLVTYMEARLQHPYPKYFRAVYCNDLVPRLPYDDNALLYRHFGKCLYYNSLYIQKDVDEEPNPNYLGWQYLIPMHLNSMWELVRCLFMGLIYGPDYKESWESFLLRVVGLVIPGLAAHSPVDYVNSVRLGRRIRSLRMMSF